MRTNILLVFSVALLCGCGPSEEKSLKEIRDKEKLVESDTTFTPRMYNELLTLYDNFAEKFPESPETPGLLLKSAEGHESLNQFDAALSAYEKLTADYPGFEKESVLFRQAFLLDDGMRRYDKAKPLYEKFIQLYPKHHFADDAEFSLKNLGISTKQIEEEDRWVGSGDSVLQDSAGRTNSTPPGM